LGALRGREQTAENVLEAAGHRDPEMDGVRPDASVQESIEETRSSTGSGRDGQSNLGDF
jgi:helicase